MLFCEMIDVVIAADGDGQRKQKSLHKMNTSHKTAVDEKKSKRLATWRSKQETRFNLYR